MVEQINGNWKVRDAELGVLCSECRQRISALCDRGYQVDVRWISREENHVADQLCNQVLNKTALRPRTVAE